MSSGKLVQVTNLDSIRIEVLGESRALTIPVECVLAADAMMRGALVEDDDVSIYECELENGETKWRAELGNWFGHGNTPWQAVIALSKRIGKWSRLPVIKQRAMAKRKLTTEEEYPDHNLTVRKCSRCYLIYSANQRRCPMCVNPEFGLVLKAEIPTMTTPWHANRESVFAVMRQVDGVVQHAWERSRCLSPRNGEIGLGGADFDYTLEATIGEQYLRTLRTGGDTEAAFESSIEAGKDSIAKWNASGCLSRAVVSGRYELHRDESEANRIALGFHSRFVAFRERPPIPQPVPKPHSRVRFGPAIIDGSSYCGPLCLSALTGIGTKQIASVLRGKFAMRAVRGVTLAQMKWFIDEVGYQLVLQRLNCSTIEETSRYYDGVFLIGLTNHWLLLKGQRVVCTEFLGFGEVTNSRYRHDKIEFAFEVQGELSESAFKALAMARKSPPIPESQLVLF